MAEQVNGHVYIGESNYDTYDHWRTYMLTHGINFDGWFGNQCYDTCALLYFQYGLTFYLGEIGYAYEAWTVSKSRNARPPFTAVESIWEVKRGDLLVFGAGWSAYGHVTFADEDYDGSGWIWTVGQNQGGGIGWGSPSTRNRLGVGLFLGAFRNTNWQQSPPTPPPTEEGRKGFPWAVFTHRIRKTRNSML